MTLTAADLSRSLAGRYSVEREIGQGGMATVFLARDLKHDRNVALKLLKPDLGAVVGIDRFLAEIKVTAALQHPNLLPLFDSGTVEGSLFYVMPYVEGETLRAKLERERQLPVDEAIRITVAVAGALDYAHQRGVIHRDLKPENILLAAGQPVVADFGIALAISNAGGARVTQTGLSLGTPQYMSPEQASGDRVIDARTDIYSLGALLYEMLTGDPPHTGSTAQAIIARLMTETPRPVRATRHTVPVHVEAAVERALEKLPADRFARASEFALALTDSRHHLTTFTTEGTGNTGGIRGRLLTLLPWALVPAAFLVAMQLYGGAEGAPDPVVRFTPRLGEVSLRGDASPAISLDGSLIAFPGTDAARTVRLYVQALDRELPQPLAGDGFESNSPFFSPDGRSVAVARRGQLVRIDVAGGSTRVICDASGVWRLGSWSSKGVIVFGQDGDLYRVSAEGGKPEKVVGRDTTQGIHNYGAPHFLPGGDVVLAERWKDDGTEVIAVRVSDGRVTPLGISGTAPQYVDGGWLLYTEAAGVLLAVPFDAGALRVRGTAVRIAENVVRSPTGRVAISRNGTVAYLTSESVESRNLLAIDRAGGRRVVPVPNGRYRFPRLSPDGRKLAIVAQRAGRVVGDVWTYELATGRAERVTFDSTVLVAEWAPDGRSLYYTKNPERNFALYRVAATGGTAPELVLAKSPGGVSTPAITADGKEVIFASLGPNNWELFTASLSGAGTPRRLTSSATGSETGTALSPDGKWLAYNANPGGTWGVYVQRVGSSAERWMVSVGGGTEPRWGANGKEIFYRGLDSVRVVSFEETVGDPRLGTPRALFADQFLGWPTEVQYDVTRDGQRFYFVSGSQGMVTLTVLLNRLEQLRAR